MFHKSMVQLELSRGDAIFFNPALFHAAGENSTTDVRRSADALQISACWGKAMESVDRQAILRATWPDLRDLAARRSGDSDEMRVDGLLQAICDGYSSPTNLDRDPPPANGVSRHIVAPWRARADEALFSTDQRPSSTLCGPVSRVASRGTRLRSSLADWQLEECHVHTCGIRSRYDSDDLRYSLPFPWSRLPPHRRGEQGNSSLSNTSMRRITSRRAQNQASNSSFNLASGSRMVNGWILGFVSTRERDSHDASSFAADLPYVTLKTDREVQTT